MSAAARNDQTPATPIVPDDRVRRAVDAIVAAAPPLGERQRRALQGLATDMRRVVKP